MFIYILMNYWKKTFLLVVWETKSENSFSRQHVGAEGVLDIFLHEELKNCWL